MFLYPFLPPPHTIHNWSPSSSHLTLIPSLSFLSVSRLSFIPSFSYLLLLPPSLTLFSYVPVFPSILLLLSPIPFPSCLLFLLHPVYHSNFYSSSYSSTYSYSFPLLCLSLYTGQLWSRVRQEAVCVICLLISCSLKAPCTSREREGGTEEGKRGDEEKGMVGGGEHPVWDEEQRDE